MGEFRIYFVDRNNERVYWSYSHGYGTHWAYDTDNAISYTEEEAKTELEWLEKYCGSANEKGYIEKF